MADIEFKAIYELPIPIWMTCATLGQTFASGFSQVTFDVVMPANDQPGGSPPAVPGLSQHMPRLTWTYEYGAFVPEDLRPATALLRIGIVDIKAPIDPERTWRTADHQLAEQIDRWFDDVRAWVEVLTGQDLDPKHRVYDSEAVGTGLTFVEPPHQDALGLRITTPRIRPIQAEEWAALLETVKKGEEPPLEELLSRDARAAQRRGANRRAVIDAATAVEIVLTRHIGDLRSTLPPNQQTRIDRKPGFGTFISIAENSGLTLQVSYDHLRSLNDLRNEAAHRGAAPGDLEVVRAVRIMMEFLAHHGHYRRMTTPEPDGSEFIVYT